MTPIEPVPAGYRRAYLLMMGLAALALVLTAVVGAVLGALAGGLLVGLALGVVAGVGGAAVWLGPAWRHAEERVVSLLHARPADPRTHARLFNLVDGLCAQSGLPRPGLYTLDTPGANAAVIGRDPRHGRIVATEGLLRLLKPIELEAVLAQALTHLQREDAAMATVALGMGRRAARSLFHSAVGASPSPGILRTSGSGWVQRQEEADLAAVALTRYPPGLVAALEQMREHGSAVSGVPSETEALWVAPIDGGIPAAGWDERIETLREL